MMIGSEAEAELSSPHIVPPQAVLWQGVEFHNDSKADWQCLLLAPVSYMPGSKPSPRMYIVVIHLSF